MKDELLIALEIIQAVGAIATAASVVLLLLKFRTKLTIKGEFKPYNIDNYLIVVSNNTQYDNEIVSLIVYKGNPNGLMSSPIHIMSVDLTSLGYDVNPNTNGIIVPKGDSIEIPLCSCDIAAHYDIVGESLGKLYDKIYIRLRDRKGHSYVINTRNNVDYFRACKKINANCNNEKDDVDNEHYTDEKDLASSSPIMTQNATENQPSPD